MTNTLFLVALLLLSIDGYAQIKAITEDGRDVLLYIDGTWEFVDSHDTDKKDEERGSMDAQKIINEHCEKKWQTDFEMQAYCREKQVEAAVNFGSKPTDIGKERWNQIRSSCWSQWENDFEMTEYCVSNQIKALRKLR